MNMVFSMEVHVVCVILFSWANFVGGFYRSCTCLRRIHNGTASTVDGIREMEQYKKMKKW